MFRRLNGQLCSHYPCALNAGAERRAITPCTDIMNTVLEIHPEVYKYSHLAYCQPSFFFYCDSVIKFCEETQQGDPESPALFSDSYQDLIDSLESQTN